MTCAHTTIRTSFYDRRIAPSLVTAGCTLRPFARLRERIIPQAEGVVVEAGFGSGLNLAHYDPARVTRLIGLDPDEAMLRLSRRRRAGIAFDLELVSAGAEAMQLESASADTVVVAYALCTIPEPGPALAEIRRVLKPGGRLLFVEHGRVEPSWLGRVQDRLNGVWGRIAGGCNLNRDPVGLIREAGFAIGPLHQERFPAYLFQLGLHSAGEAVPR